MDIPALVDQIQKTPGCSLRPALGLPIVCEHHDLPEDLKQFYRLSGGANLFENEAFPIRILPPFRIVLANSFMLVGLDDEEIAIYKQYNRISWSWYLLADYGNRNYITIDLCPERLGRCYNSNHELHPDSPLVANSFTELLQFLLAKNWPADEGPDWPNLGSP